MLVGRPVLSRILSTICPLASSNTMIESGYAPINSVAPGAAEAQTISTVSTESSLFIIPGFALSGSHCLGLRPIGLALRALRSWVSWEDQIQITPVFGRGGAFAGPIGIVVEMIGH